MSIEATQAVQATGARPSDVSSAAGDTLDYSAFLKLLIAQIENQDPLEPTNSTDYVAQLATFSEVEQSVKMNDMITELLANSRITEANALVGSEISSGDGLLRGVVQSVRITDQGSVAVLRGGSEMPITANVVIHRSAASE
jgi:flagellar basal-body rod modification protein FlgD